MTVIRLPRSRRACSCGCRSTDLDGDAVRVTGVAAYLTQRQAALRDLPDVRPPTPTHVREHSPSQGISGREASAAAGPG